MVPRMPLRKGWLDTPWIQTSTPALNSGPALVLLLASTPPREAEAADATVAGAGVAEDDDGVGCGDEGTERGAWRNLKGDSAL